MQSGTKFNNVFIKSRFLQDLMLQKQINANTLSKWAKLLNFAKQFDIFSEILTMAKPTTF